MYDWKCLLFELFASVCVCLYVSLYASVLTRNIFHASAVLVLKVFLALVLKKNIFATYFEVNNSYSYFSFHVIFLISPFVRK